jgi:hypothetical protein
MLFNKKKSRFDPSEGAMCRICLGEENEDDD